MFYIRSITQYSGSYCRPLERVLWGLTVAACIHSTCYSTCYFAWCCGNYLGQERVLWDLGISACKMHTPGDVLDLFYCVIFWTLSCKMHTPGDVLDLFYCVIFWTLSCTMHTPGDVLDLFYCVIFWTLSYTVRNTCCGAYDTCIYTQRMCSRYVLLHCVLDITVGCWNTCCWALQYLHAHTTHYVLYIYIILQCV